MPTLAAQKQSYRLARTLERHFERNRRSVLVYGDPNKADCPDCASIGPLGGAVDSNCGTCSGEGYIISDSSVCLEAIVSSAEPRRGVRYGEVEHQGPGSYHHEAYYVLFELDNVILDPVAEPDVSIFEKTGISKIAWGGTMYIVDSYARDGFGSEDLYVKVLVHRSE